MTLAAWLRVFVGSMAGLALLACHDSRARLDQALRDADHRPVRGRLSGLSWAPLPRVARSADSPPSSPSQIRLRLAANQVLQSEVDDTVKASAALLAGYPADAMARLKRLTSAGVASAAVWNDYAVSLDASGRGDIHALCRALAAADRALDIDPASPEALFNRAQILDSLSLRDAAIKALERYLFQDSTTAWAFEARDRLVELRRTQDKENTWAGRLPALERVAAADANGSVREATLMFPQDARVSVENDLLGKWGQAIPGDAAKAPLNTSRLIGQALRGVHGDELTADAVAVIDAAVSRGDRNGVQRLARAHVAFRDARVRYRARDVAGALPLFREAAKLFAAAGSPMSFEARYYLANALIDSGDRAAASGIARSLDREAPARYGALRAEVDWLHAVLMGMDGSYDQSLHAFERAAGAFDALGERAYAADIRDRIASLMTMLGRTEEAWQLRKAAFSNAGESGNPRRLETTLYSAVSDAVHEKEWDVAHALLALVADVQGGNVRLHAEALIWRALAAKRAAMDRTAESELRAARQAATLLSDPTLREDVEDELRLVEALLVRDRDPQRSVSLLSDYLASAQRRGRTVRLTHVFVERARDLRTLRRNADAEVDLRQAIALVEAQRAAMGREDLRDSFLGTSGTPYGELADLLEASGNTQAAMDIADRRRGRAILDRLPTANAGENQQVVRPMPGRTALLTYSLFDDRLIIFAMTSRGLERFRTERPSDLESMAFLFQAALSEGKADKARQLGSGLYRLLIAPAAPALRGIESLVIVADEPLQRISFPALVAEDGRYLIEHYSIGNAPSVRLYLAPSLSKPASVPPAVIIGNPRFDPARFPDLSPLPAAENEAWEVARLYPSPLVLTAEQATKERILQALPTSGILHLGTHAVNDPTDARRSALLLAGTNGALSIGEIAAMRFSHLRCVVLAGCRTAAAEHGYGDLRTFAAAFLAAGAKDVVATLWNVDDDLTRVVVVDLHRSLRGGLSPSKAVREAQLRMIRSHDRNLSNPFAWAGFVVYGVD